MPHTEIIRLPSRAGNKSLYKHFKKEAKRHDL